MLNRFINWCQGLEPEWIGIVIYMTTVLTLLFAMGVVTISAIFYTRGRVLFVLAAAFLAYVWYVALFMQP